MCGSVFPNTILLHRMQFFESASLAIVATCWQSDITKFWMEKVIQVKYDVSITYVNTSQKVFTQGLISIFRWWTVMMKNLLLLPMSGFYNKKLNSFFISVHTFQDFRMSVHSNISIRLRKTPFFVFLKSYLWKSIEGKKAERPISFSVFNSH